MTELYFVFKGFILFIRIHHKLVFIFEIGKVRVSFPSWPVNVNNWSSQTFPILLVNCWTFFFISVGSDVLANFAIGADLMPDIFLFSNFWYFFKNLFFLSADGNKINLVLVLSSSIILFSFSLSLSFLFFKC